MMDPDEIDDFLETCWREDEDSAFDWWLVMSWPARNVLADIVGVVFVRPLNFNDMYCAVRREM